MKLWMRSAAVGATVLVFAGLLACRSAERRGGAEARDNGAALQPPDPSNTALHARYCVKSWVVHELIAGRLSLLEAAAAFKEADTLGPDSTVMTGFPQSASPEEAYCRSVIAYVQIQAPSNRAEGMCRGLEEELSARLRVGALRLPKP